MSLPSETELYAELEEMKKNGEIEADEIEKTLRYSPPSTPTTQPLAVKLIDSSTGEVVDPELIVDKKARDGMKVVNQQVKNLSAMMRQFQELMSITIEQNVKAKLEEVGAMRSEKNDQLQIALTTCKVQMGCIVNKTSRSNYGVAKYANLSDLQAFANPHLCKNGLSIDFDYYEIGQKDYVKGTLSHISGQFKCNLMEVVVMQKGSDEKGNKKPISNTDIESAYTYAKKRLFALFLGLHCGA